MARFSSPIHHPFWGFSNRALSLLLGLLILLVLWTLCTEFVAIFMDPDEWDDGHRVEYSYPSDLMATDWSTRISEQELVHLSVLHRACVNNKESIIPWHFGRDTNDNKQPAEYALINSSDPNILEKIRTCPDIDVFLSAQERSFGYCEDAMAYTKFLKARLLPKWVMTMSFYDEVLGRNVTYHELCPNTPMIFFNHYWKGIPDAPDWPKNKMLYLMPNIEMYELVAEHYWRADVILCKSAICARYLKKWYKQEGNPRNTRVFFTRHTTSNVALELKSMLGKEAKHLKPKDFSHVEFVHTAGSSIQKGTARILMCWLTRPDYPPLHIYIDQSLYKGAFAERYDDLIYDSKNIHLHTGRLNATAFGKVIVESSFFLCPSIQEGYGHYINQARAGKGLIVTTDVEPMNELITPSSGVLVRARRTTHKEQFLGGKSPLEYALKNVPGFVANFRGSDVCEAVDTIINRMSPVERQRRAEKAYQQYYYDTIFFAQKMQDLLEFSRVQTSPHLRHRNEAPFDQ